MRPSIHKTKMSWANVWNNRMTDPVTSASLVDHSSRLGQWHWRCESSTLWVLLSSTLWVWLVEWRSLWWWLTADPDNCFCYACTIKESAADALRFPDGEWTDKYAIHTLSIHSPLTPISHCMITLYLMEGFECNLTYIFIMWVAIAEKVFKVRG